ncbi:hypothetical protein ABW21_db0209921 [Orbilia brochopaga]|nr:hypothetical protein ABW21_db0209921 [Drechslerella brochopaga]
MSTTSLRPLLRSSTQPLTRPTITPAFTITPTQRRNATVIRRPQRPYTFEQIVILSDGSSYKQLTTSPQGVFRSNKDVRNHFLWNPLSDDLANVEEDEAGRLKKFREKFGTGFDATKALAEAAGDLDAVDTMRKNWQVGGKMHEGHVDRWKGKIAWETGVHPDAPTETQEQESKVEQVAAAAAEEVMKEEEKEEEKEETVQPADNLFGLISGSYTAAPQTDYGRRARRAKRNAKGPADKGGKK